MAWRTFCDWENWRPRGEEASTLTVHSLKRPMVSVHAHTIKRTTFMLLTFKLFLIYLLDPNKQILHIQKPYEVRHCHELIVRFLQLQFTMILKKNPQIWDIRHLNLINELLNSYSNCWQLIIWLIISLLLRSGQAGVPAGPREPGNLSESFRPDRALLQHWRRGLVSGSGCRPAAAAVPLPAVWGPDGRLPAIMLNPPSLRAPPSSSPLLISLTLSPLPWSRVTKTLGSPLLPSPPHRQRDWFNHYHDYEKCNITGARVCTYVQRGSSSAVLSASLWRFHSSFCLALSPPLRLNPTLPAQAPASPTSRLSL